MKRRTLLLGVPAFGVALASCKIPDRQVTAAPTGGPSPTPLPQGTPVVLASPTVLPSGVKVQDITVGTGAQPGPSSYVQVHYRGTLAESGAEFDSSYRRGARQWLQMSSVIKGFAEGLSAMKVGGKRTMFIPAALAYGPGTRPGIPANADLVFEVELFEVSETPPTPAPATATARP
ncbi:MAG: FKBP-type peptidyl-prolyl cis-trans isomerase [Thermoflexaceae bacterium]|nr:FKBP-type peptidyl-prolyl cis-trans isomerase [Thermoflexaceae bacterium]